MPKLAVVIYLMSTAVPVAAQTTLGMRGGVGFASVSIEEVIEQESITGIAIGPELGVPVSEVFSLRFAGTFAQKGGGGTIEDIDVTLNIDYIQASALARVATPGEGLSVGVMAGPWAAYRLSCDVGAAGQGLSLSAACGEATFADFDIKTWDFGVAVGGGVELPVFGSRRLRLDALYALGLASVDENDTKTRHLTLQWGLAFPIG